LWALGHDAGVTFLDQAGLESARAHPLDSVVWSSLTGPHARFAEVRGGALRYPATVSPWAALAPTVDQSEAEKWADLAALVGRGGGAALTGPPGTFDPLPAGWSASLHIPGIQMVATEALVGEPDPEAMLLGDDDVADMLDLVQRAEPGPFRPRTHELGRYLGIRRDGVLVAMAGERLHPPGWIEVSAVCTDPAFRGQGLAARLIRAVCHGIREGGDVPYLAVAGSNTTAIRLYESLGFSVRRRTEFVFVNAPGFR